MKAVVKYGVYWNILLRVLIYVTKCIFFYEKPVNHNICQIAIRRPVKGGSRPPGTESKYLFLGLLPKLTHILAQIAPIFPPFGVGLLEFK